MSGLAVGILLILADPCSIVLINFVVITRIF